MNQGNWTAAEDEEINLYDIFFYVLKYWRVLIILMIVFAVLMGAVKWRSAVKERKESIAAHEEWDAKTDEEKSAKGVTEPEVIPASSVVKDVITYTILGLFVGLLLGALFYAVRFCLLGLMTNAPYVSGRYRLTTFGVLPEKGTKVSGKKSDKLDRTIMNKVTYRQDLSLEDSAKLTAANLNMKLADAPKALLMGTVSHEKLEQVKRILSPYISTELEVAGNVNGEASAVEALASALPVILVEQVHQSRQAYVDFEVGTIQQSKSACAGMILTE